MTMTDTALIVLQDLMDFEKIQGQHIEICPATSQDAYQAISIKHEAFSDAEEEHNSDETLLRMVKPEVSSVSISILGRFHKYRHSSFYEHSVCKFLLP
jgi:hypothetical protein